MKITDSRHCSIWKRLDDRVFDLRTDHLNPVNHIDKKIQGHHWQKISKSTKLLLQDIAWQRFKLFGFDIVEPKGLSFYTTKNLASSQKVHGAWVELKQTEKSTISLFWYLALLDRTQNWYNNNNNSYNWRSFTAFLFAPAPVLCANFTNRVPRGKNVFLFFLLLRYCSCIYSTENKIKFFEIF